MFCRNDDSGHWTGNKRPLSLASQASQGSEDVFMSSYPPPSMQPTPAPHLNTFGRNQQPITMAHIPPRADPLPNSNKRMSGPHNNVPTISGGTGMNIGGLPPPDLTTGRSNYTDVQTHRQQKVVSFIIPSSAIILC